MEAVQVWVFFCLFFCSNLTWRRSKLPSWRKSLTTNWWMCGWSCSLSWLKTWKGVWGKSSINKQNWKCCQYITVAWWAITVESWFSKPRPPEPEPAGVLDLASHLLILWPGQISKSRPRICLLLLFKLPDSRAGGPPQPDNPGPPAQEAARRRLGHHQERSQMHEGGGGRGPRHPAWYRVLGRKTAVAGWGGTQLFVANHAHMCADVSTLCN